MEKISIKELAKKLNVSVSAISRYFNNGYLSEEKKQIIKEGVEKYLYSPNKNAQAINSKKLEKVAFVSTGINVTSVNKIINELSIILKKLNISYEISFYQYDYDYAKKIITSLVNSGFKNIVIFMAQRDTNFEKYLQTLTKSWNINVVVFGQEIPQINCVCQNDEYLTQKVLENINPLLINKALYIGRCIEDDEQVGKVRFNEFDKFCKKNNIELQQVFITTKDINKTQSIIQNNLDKIKLCDLIFLGYSDVARYCVKELNLIENNQKTLCGVAIDQRIIDVSNIKIINKSPNRNILVYQILKLITKDMNLENI